jgi:hypothetical protein|nr:MAG TPA: hypothetical protein [Caudoviricetes sp.]
MFWNRFKWNAEQRTAVILAIIAIPEFPFFDFDSDMAEYAVATAPILKKLEAGKTIRSAKDLSLIAGVILYAVAAISKPTDFEFHLPGSVRNRLEPFYYTYLSLLPSLEKFLNSYDN